MNLFKKFFIKSSLVRERVDVGQQLLENVIEKKLLIIEDIGELKSAFKSELEFLDTHQHRESNCFQQTRILCVSLIFSILAVSISISLYHLYVILLLLPVIILLIFPIYKKFTILRSFRRALDDIVWELQKEKELLNKLFQLIEDNVVFTDNERYEQRIQTLKLSFRQIGLESYNQFSECTKFLVKQFPLKEDIDENLICLNLPEDSFDDSRTDDKDIDLNTMKSLKQLVRLQKSEFLKRLIYTFMRNYLLLPDTHKCDFYSYVHNELLKPLTEKLTVRIEKLNSVFHLHNSFFKQEIVLPDVLPQSAMSNLWPICRNLRKNFYSSLSILEEFSSIIESNHELELSCEDSQNLMNKLDLLNAEYIDMQSSYRSIMKFLAMKNTQKNSNQICKENIEEAKENVNESKKELTKEEEYVVQDQVLEAETVNDTENNWRNNEADFLASEEDYEREKEASNNVYLELKYALKNKAIEHKVREAKVLGQPVDYEKFEEEFNATLTPNNRQKEKGNVSVSLSTNNDNSNEMTEDYPPRIVLNLNIDLTKRAAMFLNEETIGSESDSE